MSLVIANILLVEDEENLHEALKLNLVMEGYSITSAFNGTAALKAIANEYFDLIILDIMLPEIDGISIIETVRVNANEVPILILSAKNSSADRVLGLKKGADDYLTKPFNLEELVPNDKVGYVVGVDKKQIADAILKFYNEKKEEEFVSNIIVEKEKFTWKYLCEKLLLLAN